MSLRGVVPPVVTPLLPTGEFDRESFDRNVNRMLDAGVHGLFVMGSSGEVAYSTDRRRDEVTRAAVEVAAGRVPVLVGAIDMQTARVVEQAQRAQDLGADAIVITAPFYGLGGPEQVERHFRVVAEAVDAPLYAYDLPVSVHTKLQPEMLVRLGVDGVLAGVKDSSGDDVSFRRLVLANRDAGSPLSLLTGHEVVVDGAYLSGADGAVPGLGNVDPHGFVRQWEAYRAGDWAAVQAEQDRLSRLMDITSVVKGVSGFGAGVGAFKTALQLLGVFTSNQMPEPVPSLTGANVEAIANVLRAEGLLD
ncbi:dihydrodipicolinate synthase family protein [Scrofimicrobium sp. R131]|uniref:Dihydrodipicolinate synthase family protein n=1 Tax=Scrofimicrobium appendicitidis TaxID=3079930 RepID=A0AAU7V7D9_9ACTO